MGKRFFALIIILMSFALVGIVFVQVYWIKNTIQITEEQFTSNVRFALAKISEDIKEDEFNRFYVDIVDRFKDDGNKLKYSDVKKYIYEKIDTASNERFTYSQSIIEENYKVPTEFFENDSIDFKEIYKKEEISIEKDYLLDNHGSGLDTPQERYV